ncbi:MAG: DUF3696 domain-containing protein [Prevotella sp.]|nr:DUF3696 domain-containing protein [Prevotella sp.]MBO5641701.1 DUF3696 domain-containing protein [Prevotella sp.]
MIEEWKLNNFKSIDKEKDLEFRPLTIFTGANSSGKSTILQSILLVTQTLQSPIASRSILLNGWFKKFGNYSDVVNKREFNKNIKIGFTLNNKSEEVISGYYGRFHYPENISNVQCEFEVSSDGNDECLQPVLEYTRIASGYGGDKADRIITVDIEKKTERNIEEQKAIESSGSKFSSRDFAYSLKSNSRVRLGYYGMEDNWKILGTSLYHFLPNYMIGYSSYKDQMKRALRECLMSGRIHYFDSEEDEKKILPFIENRVYKVVDDIYEKKIFRDVAKYERTMILIKKKITIARIIKILSLGTLDGNEKQKYVNNIVDALDALPEQYVTERMPLYYLSGVEFIRDFFNERIKYLGPLREEPRSLYPLESNGNTFDLGLKGENTAAVFENYKTKKIKYISPKYFENGIVGKFEPIERTLSEAINDWLVYLGVANKMNTNDRGKVGHELKITTDIQDMEQDLTHVGVGVSQILPILVMCFLAGMGDSIILEQPELHLHPKVQTRLADFFVSMNVLGKQCILETHSEYLINRLRYLVAKTSDEKISQDTMIYFVEKEEGHSIYRNITINKYGVIDDWPKGFFDESEDIASMTLRAGMEKRKREQMELKD